LKPKTGFESGSSPTATATVRVSESGALIQTGRGLEETKRRIMEAFEEARKKHTTSEEQHPAQHVEPPTPPPQIEYTEQHKTHFHERAKRLSLAALSSSHNMNATRSHVFEIAVPTETPEELYKAALGGDE
jgi:hypothetical protein